MEETNKLNTDQCAYLIASSLTSAFFTLNAQMTSQNGIEPEQDKVMDRVFEVYKNVFTWQAHYLSDIALIVSAGKGERIALNSLEPMIPNS